MRILTIPAFLREIGIPARLYFQDKLPEREIIRSTLDNRTNDILRFATGSRSAQNLAPTNCVDVSQDWGDHQGFVHLVRLQENCRLVKTYPAQHLVFSLTTHYLFKNGMSMKDKLDNVVFTWYYYWFMNRDKDVGDLTHNVCFQLEEMIKNILDKELTTYREMNTQEVIIALRQRLSSERLVNMGSTTPRGINFRR